LTSKSRAGSRHVAARAERGVRAIAIFEACKGVVVLIGGFGLLHFLHHDIQSTAEELVRHSHLNPARHYPRIFIEAAKRTNDSRLWFLASMAFIYSSARLVEAWGLWRLKSWAQWFAIVSGAIYIPIEVVEIIKRVTVLRVLVLAVNIFIVIYLIYVRWWKRPRRTAPT
jgi:uncharacterized membrane protein (DUF2068 family)